MENVDPEQPLEVKTRLPRNAEFEFASWMKTNGYAPGTIRSYHLSILKMVGKGRYISPEKIRFHLSKNNTLIKRSSVKLFLIFLEDIYKITIAPFRYVRLNKKYNSLEVVSKESFEKILLEIRSDLRLFAKLMYSGAFRLSEVIRMQTDWFNWDEWLQDKTDYGQVKIIKAKRDKERIIPINPALMQEIFDYIPKHENGPLKKGYLFDFRHHLYIYRKKRKGYSEESAERLYISKSSCFFQVNLSLAAEKAIGRRIKTHMLRSSRATHLDEAGMSTSSIRDFLGHDNISTTSRYIINTPGKLKKQIKQIEEKNI